MLAEIFFLRLEALLRASQEAVPEKDPRFVSIPALPVPASENAKAREKI